MHVPLKNALGHIQVDVVERTFAHSERTYFARSKRTFALSERTFCTHVNNAPFHQ